MLQRVRAWHMPLAAGAVGFLTFAISLGLPVIDPTNIDWLFQDADLANHFLAWHLFRHAPWTNPVGAFALETWPIGTSVGLTDSIPLVAVALKPLDAWLPLHFQYIGLWLVSCFVLQGVFGALLMRVATPHPTLQLLGACMLVMSPLMVVRYHHAALTAHWMILAALLLYVTAAVPGWRWLLLCSAAAATNPYLLLMVVAVCAAAYMRWALTGRQRWLRCGAHLAAVVACVATVLWQSGDFVVGVDDLHAPDFGSYSLNLLTPFIPMSAYAIAFNDAWVLTSDAYASFGAGMLALGLLAVALALRRAGAGSVVTTRAWRPHVPLLLAIVVLVLLALGPSIALGSWALVEYDARWWGPLTVFRTNGRMFWPAYYSIAFLLLYVVVRLPSGVTVALLTGTLVLQAADLSFTYRTLRRVRHVAFDNPLHSGFWEVVPRHYKKIVLYPSVMCTPEDYVAPEPFLLVAGRDGLAINAGEPSRVNAALTSQYCQHLDADVRMGRMDADTLYVLRRDLASGFSATAPQATCLAIDQHRVCFATGTAAAWQDEFDITGGRNF